MKGLYILRLHTESGLEAIYLHFCKSKAEAMQIFQYEVLQNIDEPFYKQIELLLRNDSEESTISNITFEQ
jgi:hypothetical protein